MQLWLHLSLDFDPNSFSFFMHLHHLAYTGHGLRLPAEIAAGRRGFPAGNEIGDLYCDCADKGDVINGSPLVLTIKIRYRGIVCNR